MKLNRIYIKRKNDSQSPKKDYVHFEFKFDKGEQNFKGLYSIGFSDWKKMITLNNEIYNFLSWYSINVLEQNRNISDDVSKLLYPLLDIFILKRFEFVNTKTLKIPLVYFLLYLDENSLFKIYYDSSLFYMTDKKIIAFINDYFKLNPSVFRNVFHPVFDLQVLLKLIPKTNIYKEWKKSLKTLKI